MRIPTSVIVMSLLTATPFGLGIRESLKAKPADADEDLGGLDSDRRSARRDREALAEYEAEAAREAAEEAKKRAEKLKTLDDLYGSEPASVGSWLGGAALGATVTEKMHTSVDDLGRDGFMMPTLDDTGDRLHGITVQISDYDYDTSAADVCGMLSKKLTSAWGPSVGGNWINAKTHQRASLWLTPCVFTIDAYVDADAWVGSLPFDAIGQTSAKLAAKVADFGGELSDDGTIEWALPGTGYGNTKTDFVAHATDAGKINFIQVSSDSDFDTVIALRDALSAKLKAQPTRDEDTGAWVWKKKPGFALKQDAGSNRFELQIGKDPYQ